MLSTEQFHKLIVCEVVSLLKIKSPGLCQLVTATALTESNLKYLKQFNNGPAEGLFQIEKKTHDDIWLNFLRFKPELAENISKFLIKDMDRFLQVKGNLYYASSMCIAHYLRFLKNFPEYNDVKQMATIWKNFYNTQLGKGRVEDFILNAKPVIDL